jgi:hypothetical protein
MHQHKTASVVFATCLVLVTFGYGLFQARALIVGPQITLFSPTPGNTLLGTTYTVRGKAQHVSQVTLNGRPIPLDAKGVFEETLLVPEGYGVLLLEGNNRFGRTVAKRIDIVGRPVRQGPVLSLRTAPRHTETNGYTQEF